MRQPRLPGRGGIHAAAVALLAVLLWPAASSVANDDCPNDQVRSQQGASFLADCRAWEMVSPVDKNGGQVALPGALVGGGVLQAGTGGNTVTYGSAASFGADPQGAPPASQYIGARGSGGWSTDNITVPIFAGSFGVGDEGTPYRLFSPDLGLGLLLSGRHCRGEESGCPVVNPPLAGTGAPVGFQNYYLRDTGGGFEALIGAEGVVHTDVAPEEFEVTFAGASEDLTWIVLSSCAALTAGAIEVPDANGCDPAQPNLYLHSAGSLTLINGSPPAALAAPAGAVSENGDRIYWTDGSDLYLRDGGATKQVDADAGGGGTFETASADGSIAYFTKAGHLWQYESASNSATDIASGVTGVFGASSNGAVAYFQDGAGIQRRLGGVTSQVAAGGNAADASNFPSTSGTARVSADGSQLLFVSSEPLTGYDNTDQNTSAPDSQVFLYDASGAGLICISCNPSGARPIGPSSIPGATANGVGPEATVAYKPRVLTAGGSRVFFDSADRLVTADGNAQPVSGEGVNDVYQWEAQATGSCAAPGGCVSIVSSGPSPDGATFVDASASGADVFFITSASLVGTDPGSADLYDARVDGGFLIPEPPIPCVGDACQTLPGEPSDPTLTTLLEGLEEPPIRYRGVVQDCRPLTRRARKVRRVAKRVTRRYRRIARRNKGAPRRSRAGRQVRRARAIAAKRRERAGAVSRAARRCRRANQSPAQRASR